MSHFYPRPCLLPVLLLFACLSCNKDDEEPVLTKPTAAFMSTSSNIIMGDTVSFTDRSSGIITSWHWTFEGGTPAASTDKNPSQIRYNTPGEYSVSLTVSNKDASDTHTLTSLVKVGVGIARFTSDDDLFYDMATVNFLNTSHMPGQSAWEWAFPGASPASSADENPQHIHYATPGSYPVTLTVTNSAGTVTTTVEGYIDVVKRSSGFALSLTDVRDGHTYPAVRVGDLNWMAKNLNYHNNETGAFCYGNNPVNCDSLGRLYTYAAALSVCPSGWHLPSDAEWRMLEKELGMPRTESRKTGFIGTDQGQKLAVGGSSGLNLTYSGALAFANHSYNGINSYGRYWTSTSRMADKAWRRGLTVNNPKVDRGEFEKWFGFSCRCVQD